MSLGPASVVFATGGVGNSTGTGRCENAAFAALNSRLAVFASHIEENTALSGPAGHEGGVFHPASEAKPAHST